ncbi:polysaccharide biosynthesis/export family protein [Akkermansiaceae bacterium]|nr:polysaccharide biosynthesis/export family protein [Akkermansiaceae bacterium]
MFRIPTFIASSVVTLLLTFTSFAAIQAGDRLMITIKGVPTSEQGTINGEYIVGRDGRIKIPLADVMLNAKGLEHDSLARSIENLFKKTGIYARPVITVKSDAEATTNRSFVSVGGMVKKSGPVAYRPGMTLLQAIQAAGDLTTFGTKKRIFVTRGKVTKTLDLRNKEHQQFLLKPEDTIVVDQKGAFDGE